MNRPNILLIVSDDHGYADRSALGYHADVRTPALDRLAAEGVTCTDAYVTAPICSPSRSGIITGRYQQRWGARWFDSASFPPDNVPTLPERLGANGYRTGYFGKVHYGPEDVGDRACPPHHGFETTFYGLAGHSLGRLHYLRHSRAAADEYGEEAAVPMAVQPMLSGDEPVEHEGFLTTELGRRAADFIADPDDDRPFFCMVAFNAVHNFCWQLPPEELHRRGLPVFADWSPESGGGYGEWYDDVIVPNLPRGREYYLAQLELMDVEIGRLLALLDDTDVARDTVVVYTTDNGGSTCNFGDNTPFRGTKYTLWEGGIRVPFLWRWPGRLPAGAQTPVLASTLDLTPTLAGLASEQPISDTDGRDLLSDLTEASSNFAGIGHDALHWDCGFQWAVRSGRWKLSWVDPESSTPGQLSSQEHAPIGSGWFLADLTADQAELDNRYQAEPHIAAALTQRHEAWRAAIQQDSAAPASSTRTHPEFTK
ncbi:sulfatase [Microlunatus sp. GCM10028923]|uniref:sulfatase family protein n=1 Tax=Microlunatus sp. GCM10028923 TaxID=3273400 RepID=UPI00360D688D